MLKFLLKILSLFIPAKTVDTIVADIAAKVDQLNVHNALKAAEAEAHALEVEAINKLKALAEAEAARAKALAERFAAFIA